MKNFLQLVLMVFVWFTFLMVHKVHAQWQTSGSDIYYNNGNVGIGTSSPSQKLDVNGNIILGMSNRILFRRNDGNQAGYVGTNDRDLRIMNSSWDGYLTFWQNPGGGTIEVMRIINGYLGIGTTNPTELLTVNGTVKAEEVIVVENVGADFVFEEDYALPELSEVEAHIKQHKRLPEIPSAEEMIEDGVKVGELQIKLLQKVEELTLYVIKLEKENDWIQSKVQKQQREIDMLKKQE